MKNKIIKMNYIYSNSKGTDINGQMLLPFIDGIAYKPIKIIITGGYLDTAHRKLTGENAKETRKKKEELIKKFTVDDNGFRVKIKKPFVINNKPMGIVSMVSLVNGYNANRESSIFLDDTSLGIKDLKLAKYFQNLKPYSGEVEALEIIGLNEAKQMNEKYFNDLNKYYELNLKSSSTLEMEMK